MASFMDRIRSSYNIMIDRKVDVTEVSPTDTITSVPPASLSTRASYDNSRTVLAPILARISIDASNIPVRHVIVDEFNQFLKTKQSELNDRLTIRANLDQSGTAFLQNAVRVMLETGSCALVPIEISSNPRSGTYDILSLRVAPITQWYNRSVEVSIYNEITGNREQKVLAKDFVAIAYNPMYGVMNESNSTLRRLIDRLSLLDAADGRLFSGQLDLIIQLPYALKNERRKDEANRRLDVIEEQLSERKYGIAYIGAEESATQMNRPVTNSLVETVVGLTESLHSQLGLTPSIFAGTATSEEMVHYNNRTILPIMKSLTDAMVGSFLTRTGIRQGQRVMAFPDLFKMAPLSQFAEAADALTRNEIMSSNEIRAQMGMHPSEDPEADELRNKNLNKQGEEPGKPPVEKPIKKEQEPNE